MTSERLPFIKAFCDGDLSAMSTLYSNTDPQDPFYKAYRAVVFSRAQKSQEERDAALAEALDNPPSHTELFILLLLIAVPQAIECNRMNDAQHAYNLMVQLSKKKLSPEIETHIHRSQFLIAVALDDYKTQFNALEKALKSSLDAGTSLWLSVVFYGFHAAIAHRDFDIAEECLDKIKQHRSSKVLPRFIYYDLLLIRFFLSSGQTRKGIEVFEKITKIPENIDLLTFFYLKGLLYIKSARWEVVDECIRKVKELSRESPRTNLESIQFPAHFQVHHLVALKALAMRDLNKARESTEYLIAATKNLNPRFLRISQWLMANIELAAKRTQSARVALSLLDPYQDRLAYSAEWARLYLLENRADEAARFFQRILNKKIPEFVADTLRFAYELSPHQLAALTMQVDSDQTTADIKQDSDSDSTPTSPYLIGHASSIKELKSKIDRVSKTKSTVHILGEPGTGKEGLARLIHSKSFNHNELFFAVNCEALSDTLLESELFGHSKSAFTGANNREGLLAGVGLGTIFLDEAQAISPHIQANLLFALEEGKIRPVGSQQPIPIHARVIVASSKPLEKVFRKDLYFLLNRQILETSPLRERTEDIPLIAKHILKNLHPTADMSLAADLIEAMKKYEWPGNVKELKGELEKMAVLGGNSPILSLELFKPGSIELKNNLPRSTKVSVSSPIRLSFEVKGYAQARLEKLRQLFTENEKMTRADVIKFLACAPNTATQDLRVLQSQGFIRRIDTSNHLRTSYYVRAQE
jgi:DNA-binding NtrC family response regulator/tetratricopeptide (TPR) repeat protein